MNKFLRKVLSTESGANTLALALAFGVFRFRFQQENFNLFWWIWNFNQFQGKKGAKNEVPSRLWGPLTGRRKNVQIRDQFKVLGKCKTFFFLLASKYGRVSTEIKQIRSYWYIESFHLWCHFSNSIHILTMYSWVITSELSRSFWHVFDIVCQQFQVLECSRFVFLFS